MKIFLAGIFCLSIINFSFAQDINLYQLFGVWQITYYKSLTLVTPGMENESEERERKQLDLNRSRGIFKIDSNCIKTTNSFLEFDSCKFSLIHKNQIQLKIVKNNYSAGYSSSFDIWADSNKVSDDFVARLNKNYSKKTLCIFDTDYKVDYGEETLKICIINKDEIALYRAFDVIVLKRKINHNKK
jgi:hypothetical protein